MACQIALIHLLLAFKYDFCTFLTKLTKHRPSCSIAHAVTVRTLKGPTYASLDSVLIMSTKEK